MKLHQLLLVAMAVSVLCLPAAFAAEVTMENPVVTKLYQDYYQVDVKGTLKLTDIDGTFEKFASFTCYLTDPNGAKYPMNINYTAPTLMADGSFTATVNVQAIPNQIQWTSSATMYAYKDNLMNKSVGAASKKFNVP